MNVVELSKFAKDAQILKNSLASNGTASERIFPDEGQATVEGAEVFGAQAVE